jgi:Cdc6-like AAA superfamily ATPase
LFSRLNLKHQFKHNFSKISGHEDIKWLLISPLNSEQPVHILLVGKPGLGKTQFLEAIEREYENSYEDSKSIMHAELKIGDSIFYVSRGIYQK